MNDQDDKAADIAWRWDNPDDLETAIRAALDEARTAGAVEALREYTKAVRDSTVPGDDGGEYQRGWKVGYEQGRDDAELNW